VDREGAERFLLEHGAAGIEHPGGTLLTHLRRVADRLTAWGAADAVVLAGLCHAAYGTDGFATALLPLNHRGELIDVIAAAAEELVYLYGSCDRDGTYPELGGAAPVAFRDRFTGAVREVDSAGVRAFLEITAANELDVFAHNENLAARHGPALLELFTRTRERLSRPAWAACQLALRPVTIGHLDHLVLTVADIQRSVEFYQRVLGITPIVFGAGRYALQFGDSKINLHRAGQEIPPHEARLMPGSADVCLIAATPLPQVIEHLRAQHVAIIEGPTTRTGACGELTSVYLRDPDGNLIEISNY
jgi:catechol 2,3-dioxygenase-like lactoylglutathione lyase family enzyme